MWSGGDLVTVMPLELDALGGKLVDGGRERGAPASSPVARAANVVLGVVADLGPAQIVGQYEENVRAQRHSAEG